MNDVIGESEDFSGREFCFRRAGHGRVRLRIGDRCGGIGGAWGGSEQRIRVPCESATGRNEWDDLGEPGSGTDVGFRAGNSTVRVTVDPALGGRAGGSN